MSKRKTKPEEISNPEHYFNRYIAKEVIHDQEETSQYYERFNSLDEMLEQGQKGKGNKSLLQMAVNEQGEMFESEMECKTVEAWLNQINNDMLHRAMLTLTNKQKTILFLRFYCEKTQRETAELLGLRQQTILVQERGAIKKLKKFYEDTVKSRDFIPT